MMDLLETILHSFVNFAMLFFEYVGVIVITFAGIQGLVNYVRREPNTRLILAKGLAMGLEFKLGSEILRTVIVRNLSEIGIVGGIIALRAALTILIHWEIKNEEKDELEKEEREAVKAQREVAIAAAAAGAKATVTAVQTAVNGAAQANTVSAAEAANTVPGHAAPTAEATDEAH